METIGFLLSRTRISFIGCWSLPSSCSHDMQENKIKQLLTRRVISKFTFLYSCEHFPLPLRELEFALSTVRKKC